MAGNILMKGLGFVGRHWFLSGVAAAGGGIAYLVKGEMSEATPAEDLRLRKVEGFPEEGGTLTLTNNRLSFELGGDSYLLVRSGERCLVKDDDGEEQAQFDCRSISRILKGTSLWIERDPGNILGIDQQSESTFRSRFKCWWKTDNFKGIFSFVFGKEPPSDQLWNYMDCSDAIASDIRREVLDDSDSTPDQILDAAGRLANDSYSQREVVEALQRFLAKGVEFPEKLRILQIFYKVEAGSEAERPVRSLLSDPKLTATGLRDVAGLCDEFKDSDLLTKVLRKESIAAAERLLAGNISGEDRFVAARFLYRIEEKEKARQVIRAMIRRPAVSADFLLKTVGTCQENKDPEMAREVLHQLEVVRTDLHFQEIPSGDNTDPLLRAVDLHEKLGDRDHARVLCFEIATRSPDRPTQIAAFKKLIEIGGRLDAERLLEICLSDPEKNLSLLEELGGEVSSDQISVGLLNRLSFEIGVRSVNPGTCIRSFRALWEHGAKAEARRLIAFWMREPAKYLETLWAIDTYLLSRDRSLAHSLLLRISGIQNLRNLDVSQLDIADRLFDVGERGRARQLYVSHYEAVLQEEQGGYGGWERKKEVLERLEDLLPQAEVRRLWERFLRSDDADVRDEARAALIRLGALRP